MLQIIKNIKLANRLINRTNTVRVKRFRKAIIGLFKMSSGRQPLEDLQFQGTVTVSSNCWEWSMSK